MQLGRRGRGRGAVVRHGDLLDGGAGCQTGQVVGGVDDFRFSGVHLGRDGNVAVPISRCANLYGLFGAFGIDVDAGCCACDRVVAGCNAGREDEFACSVRRIGEVEGLRSRPGFRAFQRGHHFVAQQQFGLVGFFGRGEQVGGLQADVKRIVHHGALVGRKAVHVDVVCHVDLREAEDVVDEAVAGLEGDVVFTCRDAGCENLHLFARCVGHGLFAFGRIAAQGLYAGPFRPVGRVVDVDTTGVFRAAHGTEREDLAFGYAQFRCDDAGHVLVGVLQAAFVEVRGVRCVIAGRGAFEHFPVRTVGFEPAGRDVGGLVGFEVFVPYVVGYAGCAAFHGSTAVLAVVGQGQQGTGVGAGRIELDVQSEVLVHVEGVGQGDGLIGHGVGQRAGEPFEAGLSGQFGWGCAFVAEVERQRAVALEGAQVDGGVHDGVLFIADADFAQVVVYVRPGAHHLVLVEVEAGGGIEAGPQRGCTGEVGAVGHRAAHRGGLSGLDGHTVQGCSDGFFVLILQLHGVVGGSDGFRSGVLDVDFHRQRYDAFCIGHNLAFCELGRNDGGGLNRHQFACGKVVDGCIREFDADVGRFVHVEFHNRPVVRVQGRLDGIRRDGVAFGEGGAGGRALGKCDRCTAGGACLLDENDHVALHTGRYQHAGVARGAGQALIGLGVVNGVRARRGGVRPPVGRQVVRLGREGRECFLVGVGAQVEALAAQVDVLRQVAGRRGQGQRARGLAACRRSELHGHRGRSQRGDFFGGAFHAEGAFFAQAAGREGEGVLTHVEHLDGGAALTACRQNGEGQGRGGYVHGIVGQFARGVFEGDLRRERGRVVGRVVLVAGYHSAQILAIELHQLEGTLLRGLEPDDQVAAGVGERRAERDAQQFLVAGRLDDGTGIDFGEAVGDESGTQVARIRRADGPGAVLGPVGVGRVGIEGDFADAGTNQLCQVCSRIQGLHFLSGGGIQVVPVDRDELVGVRPVRDGQFQRPYGGEPDKQHEKQPKCS